ncbi:MAG TPA: hypothetical protein VH229_12360, partial [Candidatus Udaeobacter sp.]|nr:hypothetical protein [Candidatus Udaeobacter sp.]
AAMEAKLSRGKAPVPDSKLEKILARYSRWRASHPEIAKSEQESNMETATNQGETTTKRLTGDDPAVERIAVSETR